MSNNNNGSWFVSPLRNEILLQLVAARGEMLDVDMYRNLRQAFPNLTRSNLERELMMLEVRGAVYVERITKTKNKVTLRKDPQVLTPPYLVQE
ncbi:MAG: hypothetical protein Kow0069_28700 [Promethearchaeota archaeon]